MLDLVRLQHFRNLVSLIAADGKILEVERASLYKIAYEHGIPLDRFNIMIQHANEYIYLIPQNHFDKEKQLEEMVKIALVDGEFAPAELELINKVAEKLAVPKEKLQEIIDLHAEKK